ncbi:hypothetical protein A8L45_23310 [Veronia pacifica]|uniref:Uncharacterized protein n=2 Tax=Veronia pacifica TaxID=1080227 RepID=A0A1C3E3N0_9GAMM|nr:hypothetical protein A8L45_23310 [Veronia pacifica]
MVSPVNNFSMNRFPTENLWSSFAEKKAEPSTVEKPDADLRKHFWESLDNPSEWANKANGPRSPKLAAAFSGQYQQRNEKDQLIQQNSFDPDFWIPRERGPGDPPPHFIKADTVAEKPTAAALMLQKLASVFSGLYQQSNQNKV